MSTPHVVAESWEDADADPTKELMEKMEKVKILQRKEEKKGAFFEKVKAEENGVSIPKLKADEGMGPIEEPKRVFLRRPKDGFGADAVADSTPTPVAGAENDAQSRSRSHHKKEQKNGEPMKTLEERQAEYKAARNRILGTEYKPDNQEIKEIKFVDRSKSPETLKMTEQNMVEHYGEELSRELMHQPESLVEPPPPAVETFPVPADFSQPPPNFIPTQDSSEFSGPPGFQHRPVQAFQQPQQQQPQQQQPQQQYMDNSYYGLGQMPMHYSNQAQFQQFVPQEATPVTSVAQNTALDVQNEQQQQQQPQQTVYYSYQPPNQQQQQQQHMNYVPPYNLPNMSYPPPNYQPQQQMMQQMYQMPPQQQLHQPPPPPPQQPLMSQQFTMPPKGANGRGGCGAPRGGRGGVAGGVGRGGAPPQQQMMMMYGMMPMGGQMQQMYQNGHQQQAQSHNQQTNGQMYTGMRNGMPPQNQQRQQFQQNQGRKKNGKPGGMRQEEPSYQMRMPITTTTTNPIPFGCPPRYVNSYREQQTNNGAGLLGPHPLMSTAPQWKNPQRPQQ